MRRRMDGPASETTESAPPWESFADALTGLLFVFILLSLSFAYQLQQAKKSADAEKQEAQRTTEQARRARDIARSLVSKDPNAASSSASVALCLERGNDRVRVEARPTLEEARISLYLMRPSSVGVDGQVLSAISWFEDNKADLRSDQCEVAHQIGACLVQGLDHPELKAHPGDFTVRVFVEGHTDAKRIASGPYPTNWELSGARAAAVVRALLVSEGDRVDCPADPDNSTSLNAHMAQQQLDVVAVGMADRKPAWNLLCQGSTTPVCTCLSRAAGKPDKCTADLAASVAASEKSVPAQDLLIAWANTGGTPAETAARQNLLKRVDLRFEVTPRFSGEGN